MGISVHNDLYHVYTICCSEFYILAGWLVLKSEQDKYLHDYHFIWPLLLALSLSRLPQRLLFFVISLTKSGNRWIFCSKQKLRKWCLNFSSVMITILNQCQGSNLIPHTCPLRLEFPMISVKSRAIPVEWYCYAFQWLKMHHRKLIFL